jgi:hypothetical protein
MDYLVPYKTRVFAEGDWPVTVFCLLHHFASENQAHGLRPGCVGEEGVRPVLPFADLRCLIDMEG